MALVLKNILVSDTLNDVVEKINFNFNQLKINGGGIQGREGQASVTMGIPGARANYFSIGIGDPNTHTFEDLIENDLYIDEDGYIWQCTDPTSTYSIWEKTTNSLKGQKGDQGSESAGVFTKSDISSNQHFYYTPPQTDIGSGSLLDIRSFLFGGYTNNGSYKINSTLAANINASDSIVYLYTPSTGIKQLKFLHESTLDVSLAPAIYTIANDEFIIENLRESNIDSSDGIYLKTVDTNININSKRDVNIIADSQSITNIGSTSAGNISLTSYDYTNNNFSDPSTITIETRLYSTDKAAQIILKSDSKLSDRYVIINSVSKGTSLKISDNVEVISINGYFVINNSQGINSISNDETFIDNSTTKLVTQYAIKTYIDNKIGSTNGDITGHIHSDGSSHTFINQSVTTTASPTFSRVYIDGTDNYIDTKSSNFHIKTGNGLLIGGNTTININGVSPDGNLPQKFIFNQGTLTSYADLEIGGLTLHDTLFTNGNTIKNLDILDGGIYISALNKIGIGVLPNDTLNYNLVVAGGIYSDSYIKVTGQARFEDTFVTKLFLPDANNSLIPYNGSMQIRTGNNKMYIAVDNTLPLVINGDDDIGNIPTSYIFKKSSTVYADFEMGRLDVHGKITLHGNALCNRDYYDTGLRIDDNGNVTLNKIPDVTTSAYGFYMDGYSYIHYGKFGTLTSTGEPAPLASAYVLKANGKSYFDDYLYIGNTNNMIGSFTDPSSHRTMAIASRNSQLYIGSTTETTNGYVMNINQFYPPAIGTQQFYLPGEFQFRKGIDMFAKVTVGQLTAHYGITVTGPTSYTGLRNDASIDFIYVNTLPKVVIGDITKLQPYGVFNGTVSNPSENTNDYTFGVLDGSSMFIGKRATFYYGNGVTANADQNVFVRVYTNKITTTINTSDLIHAAHRIGEGFFKVMGCMELIVGTTRRSMWIDYDSNGGNNSNTLSVTDNGNTGTCYLSKTGGNYLNLMVTTSNNISVTCNTAFTIYVTNSVY